ncbi:TonB-dependent receptor [Trinickia caryophylli]|uniref:Outer membrane receptor proteins, mostly Fe transport n=1 Tax=Trinickia caryophylli TaxID=28094 RepID=A0A1X7E2U3_TRICW|nr:TonB-dependent receptor [Trinickia caryophylli]PMS14046.1 TonB-dependent receptor [Trinickia caryophylli]TRX17741.1 TonB-dependent receptor [Trinickia caryophylli]WQE11498.1 TonB-dependent receptor [Trinickia caryophylli]SMF25843.1 Outer membrane receptor proteins, mostly Fe transport [Trinickia caryophylli]GLU32662.1 membrane protein [Trinickia caryophylli]
MSRKKRRVLRPAFGRAARGALASLPLAAWIPAQAQTPAAAAASASAATATAPAVSPAGTRSTPPPQSATAGEPPAAAAASTRLQPIVVVGTTPLLGIGTPLAQVPANVQTVRARDLERQHRQTLAEYFEKNLPSVDINEAQGNPYQIDVNYRGFTASPLVGTPQGLSVFLDGVRVNEPFGDVVNWDLIPEAAIDQMQLIPGSNPTYGLNTLGGALAITTKNGKTSPGGEAEVSIGSRGRKTAQIEQGGTIGSNLDYYFTANAANDNGWADHNSSRVRQAFGKLRYTDADTTLSLSAGGADNTLEGSQTLPRSFLDNPGQAYTFPDRNENSVGYLTLSGEHAINDHIQLSGNAYYRHYRNRNLSSNTNEEYGTVDATTGDIDTVQGTNERSEVSTDSYGASLQMTVLGNVAGHDNQLVAGVAADIANSRYTAASQDAFFTASRATIGVGDFTQKTDAKTRSANYGIYLSDTLSLTKQWTLTLAGRYNWSSASIGDASGTQPALDGRHVFSRFNPAVGLNWNPTNALTVYATYNEGMRAPTAIELACADPNAPCSLPNDFLADPALKPVVSKTFELGARGRLGAATTWSAAVYSTTLVDDIQFIGSAGSSQGYFQNVGKTRRQGVELAGRTKFGPLAVGASYSYVDATYRTSWTENSASNSSADANGDITVKRGDHIPGIPAHTIKVRFDYDVTPKWDIGSNLTYRSSIFARGDENNEDVNGKLAGYFLIDLDTTYHVTKQLQVFARVTNLLDKRYASFGVLGSNVFTGPGHTFDGANPVNEQFVGVGAPRGFWLGMRYAWN